MPQSFTLQLVCIFPLLRMWFGMFQTINWTLSYDEKTKSKVLPNNESFHKVSHSCLWPHICFAKFVLHWQLYITKYGKPWRIKGGQLDYLETIWYSQKYCKYVEFQGKNNNMSLLNHNIQLANIFENTK